MQPSFKPPKTKAEFEQRASEMSVGAANALKSSIEQRRKAAVAPFDLEIAFYDAVLKFKETGEVPEFKQ